MEAQTNEELFQFRKNVLDLHNQYRSNHGVGNVTMDDSLNIIAQNRARALIRKESTSDDIMASLDLNENRSTGTGGSRASGEAVVNQWYSEIHKYSYKDRIINHDNAHFCQLVWKNTIKIGVGYVFVKDEGFKVCVLYQPKGNYKDELEENVLPRM